MVARASELLEENRTEPVVACVKNYRNKVPLETASDHPRCAWGIKNDCGCGQGSAPVQ